MGLARKKRGKGGISSQKDLAGVECRRRLLFGNPEKRKEDDVRHLRVAASRIKRKNVA